MSRRFKQEYLCRELDELARQLIRAPAERRGEQVRRAERLHDEIDPDATYPLDYLAYRITRYRRGTPDAVLLVGQAVQPDLRLLIDSLSRSIDMPPTPGESFESSRQLAERLGVSVKTIERWRRDGLRWRWVSDEAGGERGVRFERRAVEHFASRHPRRVARAGAFTQMPEALKRALLDRARRIATGRDVSLSRVAEHLARRVGRSHEAVRQLLLKHDADNPGDRIFDRYVGPLTPRDRRVIARAARRGIPLDRLARRFNKTRDTIRRAIRQTRLERLMPRRLEGFESPTFHRPDADQVLLHSQRAERAATHPGHASAVPTDSLPQALRPLYQQRVYDHATQELLFTRYNYLKFRARTLRRRIDPSNPLSGQVDQLERWIDEIDALRQRLIRAGLPAVLSVVRRHQVGESATRQDLQRLLLIGNRVLFEAVDAFDPFRARSASAGPAFESFLTNQLLKRFASQPPPSARPRQATRRDAGRRLHDLLIDDAHARGVNLLDRERGT